MDPNKLYNSYVVDIKLPPAIIVPLIPLTLGYILILLLDYVLIKNDTKLASIVSPTNLRYTIFCYHVILPLLFASKYDFGNISFMLQPWVSAIQIVLLAKSQSTLREWIPMMIKIATFQDESPTSATQTEIKMQGVKKILRGLTKIGFMKIVLDGVLPNDLSDLLALPFYSPQALFITYVLAARIYCMMGIADVMMGLVQALFLVRFKDVFNNPFIASSPKDFWNKRWNRVVSHMFHQFLFAKVKKQEKQEKEKKYGDGLLTSPTACGLFIFLISGLFHDFMIAAATRSITFELTMFFLIHGIVVALEVTYRTGKYKKDPTGFNHVVCHVLTILFFTTTGRLFLSAVLRQQVFLEVAQQF